MRRNDLARGRASHKSKSCFGSSNRQSSQYHGPSTSSSRCHNSTILSSSSDPKDLILTTNAYNLELTKQNYHIFEYSLDVSISQGCEDQSTQVLNRNFVSRSIRRLIMSLIIKDFNAAKEVDEGAIIIGTNMDAIYSLTRFKYGAGDHAQPFKFNNLTVDTDLLNQLQIDITIRYIRKVPLDHPGFMRAILNSALHHQLLLDMLRFGSAYYPVPDIKMSPAQHRETQLDLISQHAVGISLSGIRKSTDDQTIVVINCPHSHITRSNTLLELLLSFMIGCPAYTLSSQVLVEAIQYHNDKISSIRGTEPWFLSFCSILEGFKCRNLSITDSTNIRFSLTEQSAQDLRMIDIATKNEVSVHEKYAQSGNLLRFPNLPCLKSKSKNHPYHPFELCSLMAGQKVPIFRLSSAAHQRLTILNKPRPDIFRGSSCMGRDQVESLSIKQFRKFGIKLSKSSIEAKGSRLSKPTLQYRDQTLEPHKDFWESKAFCEPVHLVEDWCVVNTVQVDQPSENSFFSGFCYYLKSFGLNMSSPMILFRPKQALLDSEKGITDLIKDCHAKMRRELRLIMFIIDSNSTALNRLIHLSFDDHPQTTATCLRVDSILNTRQHRSIYRTLAHKVNARLGGTNVTYNSRTLTQLHLRKEDLLIIGLDVTHPDNELSGVSIVGCAYTCSSDLFRHRSLVWPQTARKEIICKMDALMKRILTDYREKNGRLPRQVIVYRDGVSHEEFEKVRSIEVVKANAILSELSIQTSEPKPNLSYIIAQKRHTMRFFQVSSKNMAYNPPGGTLIDKDVVNNENEFYLYSNTSPQATSRPLHYHVLVNGLSIEVLQKLTYFLCFNFGKCSGTLSMPSSLKYAHNAAYDARNRVLAAREFSENKFYTNKFFC